MIGLIHSTESFGTVDGPGIRFVVFFSGCPMRCLYCHNPDTWTTESARKVTVDQILKEYDGVKSFLKSGGLTATGGEPLLQIDFLLELFMSAKKKGIHTCLDTSGITFRKDDLELVDKMNRLMEVTDLVMLDIKHVSDEEHKKLTGQSNHNIFDFLLYLSEHKRSDGSQVEIWIRHVVVPGITLNDDYLFELGKELGKYRIKALDVLPYHDMAKPKYENLGIAYPLGDTPPATKEEAVYAREKILSGMRKTREIS